MSARPGVGLYRLTEADWASHRRMRLQMLAEAPDAFWSTYDEIADQTEAQWRLSLVGTTTYLQARSSEGDVLGTLGVLPQGYADTVPLAHDAVNLIAIYVVPQARGQSVGDQLLAEAAEITTELGRQRMLLEVACSNAPAIRLYERNGFHFTGNTTPHPRRLELVEREMERVLAA